MTSQADLVREKGWTNLLGTRTGARPPASATTLALRWARHPDLYATSNAKALVRNGNTDRYAACSIPDSTYRTQDAVSIVRCAENGIQHAMCNIPWSCLLCLQPRNVV